MEAWNQKETFVDVLEVNQKFENMPEETFQNLMKEECPYKDDNHVGIS